MKNLLYALPIIALSSISLGTSAQALPASSIAEIQKTVTPSTENVRHRGHGYRYHHRYYGYRYGYGYGYGHGYGWRHFCYNHPYNWRCQEHGY